MSVATKSDNVSEVGVRMLLEPKVLAEIIKGRGDSPLLRDGWYQLPSNQDTQSILSAIALEKSYEVGREMEKAIGRLLLDAIAPKLSELSGKGNVVLTLVAKREE